MSVTDVTARIGQIEGQLQQLAPQPFNPATAASFAQALANSTASSATGTDPLGAPAVATGGNPSEQQVVDEARKYLGIPYVWGGTNPDKGLDCSGLVQLVYKNLGYTLPRVSGDQAKAGTAVAGGLANARPGDLLAFNSPVSHIGIYIGDGKMIHAPRPGKDVEVSDVYDTPVAIRRVLPSYVAAGAGASSPMPNTAMPSTAPVSALTAAPVPATIPYAGLFNAAGSQYGVAPSLLAAVAKAESAFNPRAVSHAGAQGLMQLMPATARGLGVANPLDPTQAVDGAARMLRDLLQRFGSTELALAAYNAGPGAVMRYDGIPPYAETQNYVAKIMNNLRTGVVA